MTNWVITKLRLKVFFFFTGVREALNIDYGILGRQFHFEKLDSKDPTSRIGCYGEPNRETTYYMANSNGYQTLKESQFLEVTHLFPTKCATASNNFGGNIKFESTQSPIVQQQLQRNARLSSDNQRMAHSIQSKLKENSITGIILSSKLLVPCLVMGSVRVWVPFLRFGH